MKGSWGWIACGVLLLVIVFMVLAGFANMDISGFIMSFPKTFGLMK